MGVQQWQTGLTDLDKTQLDNIERNTIGKMTPIKARGFITPVGLTPTILAQVVGRGIFSHCLISSANYYSGNYLEIDIDGRIFKTGLSTSIAGIVLESMITNQSSSLLTRAVNILSSAQIQYFANGFENDITVPKILPIGAGMVFENSCKITVYSTANNNNVYYDYEIGVK